MRATAPPELPVPKDDGACSHLAGTWLAPVPLPSTSGDPVDLSRLPGRVVIYCDPMTGKPGIPLPPGWAEIPGAMGCTPEACGFRDHAAELAGLDARVFGISTQTTEEQLEAKERLKLPYALLSDERLDFVRSLRLPTFDAAGRTLLKRLTIVAEDARIARVFYPVFPPGEHAAQVVSWLRSLR